MKPRIAASLALVALLLNTAIAQPPPSPENAEPPSLIRTPSDGLVDLIDALAQASGMEFVVDPRVRANPTYVGGSSDITYSKLLSILRVHGYTAVTSEGRVHVVPTANARQLSTRLLQQDDPSVSDDEIVTRVIELDGEAARMVPILRPMLPQYAHLASDGERSLVIVDHYDNVRRITAIAEMLAASAPSERR